MGADGALIGVANVATDRWAAVDLAGRSGNFEKAAALQSELASVKELVFNDPVVEAVARIKAVLQHEGLIKSAAVRRPQLGISDVEKTRLLESYQALKRNEFRAGAETEGTRNQTVG